MSLGASFALASDQVDALLSCANDEERVAWLEDLEESVADDAWLQFDKAWDALHRCLGDGGLEIMPGAPTVAYAVFGSQPLMEAEATHVFAGLLPADETPAVAAALADVDRKWLQSRYETLDDTDYGQPLSDEDFDYTWEALRELQSFSAAAARSGQAIVFTVSE